MGKEKKSNSLKNFDWRNLLDKIHVYGGLFITVYLLILGISSLNMQHHFINLREGKSKKLWEQKINMPVIENQQNYKQAVKDSLGLYGGTPWWEDYKDDNGIHHFLISRPGKKYWVEVPANGNVFKIEESHTGLLNVAMVLHGLTGGMREGPGFVKIWKFFGQIMNIVFFIAICITVYFWFERSFRTYRGWTIAGGFIFSAIIILVFIWLIG